MSCNCQINKTTRPNETCLFCCNKHLAGAYALIEPAKNDFSLIPRIASQIKLASWHFNKNFENESKICDIIVDKIFNCEPFIEDLQKLIERTWHLLNNEKDNKTYNYFNERNTMPNSISLKDGLLAFSNAIELYNYEQSYENVNMSYIIGQLILASWHLQSLNKSYGEQCRYFYNHLKETNISKLEEFRNFLWKKFYNTLSNSQKDQLLK